MNEQKYDTELKYEAIQEAITQLVAGLYAKKRHRGACIDEIISKLINYKKNMTPDNAELNREVSLYLEKVLKEWNV